MIDVRVLLEEGEGKWMVGWWLIGGKSNRVMSLVVHMDNVPFRLLFIRLLLFMSFSVRPASCILHPGHWC